MPLRNCAISNSINFEISNEEFRQVISNVKDLYGKHIQISERDLEDRLNIKLFKRNHKGIKITPEGKEVLEYVKKSYNDISVGERSLKENRNLNSGKISIGVQSHIGRFFLFPYIEKFHKKYPNIEINISSRNTAELIKFLENNDIDFVIDTSPIETEYSNLVIEPFITIETTEMLIDAVKKYGYRLCYEKCN